MSKPDANSGNAPTKERSLAERDPMAGRRSETVFAAVGHAELALFTAGEIEQTGNTLTARITASRPVATPAMGNLVQLEQSEAN